MARGGGASKVYFASAPPIQYPNVYGIDMPAAHELIAHGRTEAEICEAIGADALFFQDLADLKQAASEPVRYRCFRRFRVHRELRDGRCGRKLPGSTGKSRDEVKSN